MIDKFIHSIYLVIGLVAVSVTSAGGCPANGSAISDRGPIPFRAAPRWPWAEWRTDWSCAVVAVAVAVTAVVLVLPVAPRRTSEAGIPSCTPVPCRRTA